MVKLYRKGDEDRIDLQDPRAVDRLMPLIRLMRRYFRYRVVGLDRVPAEGPALICMNHGPVPVDAPLLGMAVYDRTGRLPRALTDHLVFRLPILREAFMAWGAVDGRMDLAEDLLRRGNLVIVMPGGAPEAFKPSADAYTLHWRRRKGFARLAIRLGVPILPAACVGIDELYHVPFDMFEAGRRLFGVRSMPLPIAWGLGPLPRRVPLTQYIGRPVLPGVPPEAAEDEEAVQGFRDRVADEMERLLGEGLLKRSTGDERG